MSNWKESALDALHRSLYPVPQELNEIDWKGGLSNKTDRLAQHLCAYSNLKGGGILVFGVNDDATFAELSKFGLDSKGTSMISHIIADTLECGLIKYENPEMSSKRYATYIPFYG